MANATRRRKGWSYSTGEWGTNRARAYDRGTKGIFIEFYDQDIATSFTVTTPPQRLNTPPTARSTTMRAAICSFH